MAADKNLIQGAATLSQAEGNMSRAFGAGLTREATRIASDIAKREEERQAQFKNDMNLAASFISKMASVGSATGQYKNILTSAGMATKNKLNEIALDSSLNAVEKAAAYTKAVDEYNVLASTYSADQEKLVALQGIVRAGNHSNTINRETEEFKIALALGTGDYEIVKDGYIVNGKKIKSEELDQYIGLYKPKNMEAFSKFDSELRKSIRDARGNKSYEDSVLNEAKNIPVEQKLNYLVDYKNKGYSAFVNENNELDENSINAVYDEVLDELREKSSVKPLVSTTTVDPSSHQGRANRYVESAQTLEGLEGLLNEALPGAWQRNGNIISFYAGNTKKNPVTEEMEPAFDSQLADVSTPEGVRAVLKLAAVTEYGEANGSRMNDYIRQGEISGYDFSTKQTSGGGGTGEGDNADGTLKEGEYPDYINNASTERIDFKKAKEFMGITGSFGNQITKELYDNYTIQNPETKKEEIFYSEKNILKAAFDKNMDFGDKLGRKSYNKNILETANKNIEEESLLNEVIQASDTDFVKVSDKQLKEMRKKGIIPSDRLSSEVTSKDLALLNYMEKTGKTINEYETLLASVDTGGLPINNES